MEGHRRLQIYMLECEEQGEEALQLSSDNERFWRIGPYDPERISQPNGSTFIPAQFAEQVAATLDPPPELLS